MAGDDELRGLYPFLYPERGSPAALDAALVHSIAEKVRESRETAAHFFEAQGPVLLAMAKALAGVYRSGGRLLAMGNGGSSCDAAHVAVEFVHPITAGRPALPALNLAADVATISAVGNDAGFERIFARQVAAQGRSGDALVGFSTSGNSSNLVEAYAAARGLGIVTLGFAGGDGGRMKTSGLVDHCLVVPTASVHRVQECHVVAYHILWDLVHTLLAQDRGPAA